VSSRQQPQNFNYSLCLCLQCNKYFLQAENIHCIQNGCPCDVLQAHYFGSNIMYFDIYDHVLHFDADYKDDGWAPYCVIHAKFCCQIWDMFETRLIHIFLTTQGCRRQSQERLNHVLFIMLPVNTMTSVQHCGTASIYIYPLLQDVMNKTCHVEINFLMLVT